MILLDLSNIINNDEIQQLIDIVSNIESNDTKNRIANSEATSPFFRDFLKEIGFGLEIESGANLNVSYHPISDRCLDAAMDTLQKHLNTWDSSTKVQDRRKFICSAVKYKAGISHKWELILLALPQFQEAGFDESNKITPVILLKELESIMNDKSSNINNKSIINCVVYWIQSYWKYDFEGNTEIKQQLEKHWLDYDEIKIEYERFASAKLKLDLDKKQDEDNNVNEEKIDHKALDYKKISAKVLAEELTLISYGIFNKMEGREFLDQNWIRHRDKAPNIMAMVDHFNNITKWVQMKILEAENLKERVKILSWMIHICDELKILKNYFVFCAVFGGLESNPIYRLKPCWKKLKPSDIVMFETMKIITNRRANQQRLRDLQYKADNDCIPHMGVIMKDLIFIDEGSVNIVSYEKGLRSGTLIKFLLSFQYDGYWSIREHKDVKHAFLFELGTHKDVSDDDLFTLSTKVKMADINEAKK